ncbi:MAG: CaiB/BaiF CoA transferase family protein [Burkholderiales bacterium]|jgi:crotonobetainyl-CoA:carnitine CoA-transferase CaiB-like acyl-CoA transferase
MARIQASNALSNLRVLDLSRVRAGPVCARHFADFGADVIKVETTGEEDLGGARDGSDFQNLHRNKRSITLDLKAPQGIALFRKLVATADVVIENYRPDVKDRLGIDYASLRQVNPRIILASISGFGQDGPYRDRPGFDQIAQGLCGLMSVTGFPEHGPLRAGAAVADVTAGLLAALGIMTALHERERTGEGQWVQSNLLQAGITLLDFQAARYTMAGEVPPQVGNDHPTSMPTSAYRTADGFINVAASGTAIWKRLCEAIGEPGLLDDARFASAQGRSTHRKALAERIDAALSGRTSSEWVEVLNAAGVPCGPIHRMDAVFSDPQVKHLQATSPVQHPTLGEQQVLSPAIRLSRTPAAVVSATPERGEHTPEVLSELGLSATEIAALRQQGVIL